MFAQNCDSFYLTGKNKCVGYPCSCDRDMPLYTCLLITNIKMTPISHIAIPLAYIGVQNNLKLQKKKHMDRAISILLHSVILN